MSRQQEGLVRCELGFVRDMIRRVNERRQGKQSVVKVRMEWWSRYGQSEKKCIKAILQKKKSSCHGI